MQFQENFIISGKIKCETGLHIGGAKETIEIGGIDNIVLRDAATKLPFIPGSSLKGKMRSLLELSDPVASKNIVANNGDPCKCGTCLPCRIFGISASETNKEKIKKEGMQKGPTRLIVRDAYPTKDTIEKRWKSEDVIQGAEVKYENTLNRITSEANPRPMERVPKNSEFAFEMIFSVYDGEDRKNLKGVFQAMKLLEDSYIGGSGTRGYGKIRIEDISINKRTVDYYKGTATEEKIKENSNLTEILRDKNLFK